MNDAQQTNILIMCVFKQEYGLKIKYKFKEFDEVKGNKKEIKEKGNGCRRECEATDILPFQ